MSRMQLIPAIDLRGGRVVRLLQGNFDDETTYEATPHGLRDQYAALGASWLHGVDLDGARDGEGQNQGIVRTLAQGDGLRVQCGGGIRTLSKLRTLLSAGVSRAVLGSVAVSSPDLVTTWFQELGPERIVLAFDVRVDDTGTPRVATHGWKEQSQVTLWEAIERYAGHVQHVLCTDVAKDGAMQGPNLALYKEAVRRFPGLQWQASGGVRDVEDLRALAQTGVVAAVSGRALLEGRLNEKELQPFLPSASSPA
jgi:phosphoribosylformimino-5-aminoimidazole carboxamide ribotide isomerase